VFHYAVTGNPYIVVKRSFHNALRRTGFRDFRLHDLRHTFASYLVMAGLDLTTVKDLLGHKTLTVTLRYAYLAPAHKVKAVEELDNSLHGMSTEHLLRNITVRVDTKTEKCVIL
jgi:integrase